MEIKHTMYVKDGYPTEVTYQLLRMSCPRCKKPVEFIVSDDDRLYKEDAEFYKKRCELLHDEVCRLNHVINMIVKH